MCYIENCSKIVKGSASNFSLMEHNGLPTRGIFSGLTSGMLGLEVPVHQQQNHQNPQQLHQTQMVDYAHHHESEHHHHPQAQHTAKHASPYIPRQQISLSDEDEHGFNGDDSTGDGKRKISPWQRMKWTDNMVRLLVMAVYYIGDEVGSEGNDPTGKKKAGGLAQKKGKWKSVSRAMMEKGFYISPQQCEDKFNDLNKRYKRVNDILGKGTSCKVVENQSLLETMDLSPKLKDEVRKLLNSKHLFYREMCAYHSSCGHSSTAVAGGRDQSQSQQQQTTEQQQQRCSHSSENAQMVMNSRMETEGSKMAKRVLNEEDDEENDPDSDEDEDDYGEDEYEDEAREGDSRGQSRQGQDDEDDHDEKHSEKRPRKDVFSSSLMHQFTGELMSVIQDGAKSPWEKKQYMKLRLLQLEEQKMSYELQAFELEKQRLKWVNFSSKKEREMERAKLQNDRKRLEHERMVLLIRQKELDLVDVPHHHHQQQQISSNKRSDPSSITG